MVKDSGANLLADPESSEAYVPIQGTDVDRSALILHTPLVAFAVAQRKRELGIRIAIGARPQHILNVLFETKCDADGERSNYGGDFGSGAFQTGA
ncbi:MAG TPA: hypothetical protein VGG97_10880 [Bryobacteraceae bacterium]